jgi:acyl-CoA synthetase (AMP-forming)/AMP-acid ligase II
MNAVPFRQHLRNHLERNARRILLRVVVSDTVIELSGAMILEQALVLAERYRHAPESGVVLLLLPHSAELFLLHLGLILDNRVPAVLAWPTSRIDPEKYQRNLLHQLRNLPASQLITLPRLAENMGPALGYAATPCPIERAIQFEQTFAILPAIESAPPATPERPAQATPADAVFLQFSGGTTGAQKAVVITADMLDTQLRRLSECLSFTPDDAVASWLPMYHDMGLIACLWLPLWVGAPSVQFSASDWLLNPASLFEYLERYRGTFCWLPNFAFSYLAAQRERMKGGYSLGHVRGWINCSEPVRHLSMNGFAGTFADWGVTPENLQASYAMAENVFAVTQTPLGKTPATFERRALKQQTPADPNLAFGLIDSIYVSSGSPLAGMNLRIMESGQPCGPGQPGEIQLRTECLFSGYWGNDGFTTTSLSADGWYSTGDYGFVSGEDLYVIGRMKDIVIVGGQNVFPEDVEAVVNSVSGIYPGRVVAFGITDEQLGTEALAVIAELRGDYDRARALAVQREIQRLIVATIGLAPRFVFVAPERWILKSTAGKISRRETRARFLRERENIARGAFSHAGETRDEI